MPPRVSPASLISLAWERLEDAAMAARLTRDLPRFVRHPLGQAEVMARLRERLATREQRLLDVVRRAIYGHPRSPYLALLRHAGCELGDVERLVRTEGIEGALRTLADRGVYVTFDESKGRREIRRGSLRLRVRATDFDNPIVKPHLLALTSGTGGRPSRVRPPLGLLEDSGVQYAAIAAAHGLDRPEVAAWWPSGPPWFLLAARVGLATPAWYYPVHPLPRVLWLAAAQLKLLGQLGGHVFPLPRRCDLDSPEPLLEWLVGCQRQGRSIMLVTMPSAAARLAIAAVRAGLDLRGTTIVAVGEPMTEARRAQIAAAGARMIVLYASVEFYMIAGSCGTPREPDDTHLMLDQYALIQRPRPVVEGGPLVDASLVTTVSMQTGKIALNTELGDHGRAEERDCGCLLGELGMRTHFSAIRSFEKMTGEGVTFARSSLEQILEDVLPARFGGNSVDYQLGEEAAADGMTRLVLRVSPRVGNVDEAALRAALLAELGREGPRAEYQAAIWRAAGTVEVRREAPLATRAGKVLPFHLAGREHAD